MYVFFLLITQNTIKPSSHVQTVTLWHYLSITRLISPPAPCGEPDVAVSSPRMMNDVATAKAVGNNNTRMVPSSEHQIKRHINARTQSSTSVSLSSIEQCVKQYSCSPQQRWSCRIERIIRLCSKRAVGFSVCICRPVWVSFHFPELKGPAAK